MSIQEKIVEAILDDMKGRKGFDGFWYSVDEDIQKEIAEDLEKIVENILNE